MTGINRLIEWLEDNKDVKISLEFIKLQAQMFALEENLNINYFESVTNIFNQKTNNNATTSIEWLENLLNTKGKLTPVDFYQAKKMNEEEIKNAYNAAYWGDVLKFETSEEYFNKTFKQ